MIWATATCRATGHREGGSPYSGQNYYAIRRGNWKLLQNMPLESCQLYNMADDPGETHNLVTEQPKKVEELSRALQNHTAHVGATAWQSGSNDEKLWE